MKKGTKYNIIDKGEIVLNFNSTAHLTTQEEQNSSQTVKLASELSVLSQVATGRLHYCKNMTLENLDGNTEDTRRSICESEGETSVSEVQSESKLF